MDGNQGQEQDKIIFSFETITFKNLWNGEQEHYLSQDRATFIAKLFNSSLHLYQDGLIDEDDIAGSIIENLTAFNDWIWVIYEKNVPIGLISIDSWEYAGDYLHSCSLHSWVAKDGIHCTKAMIKAAKYTLNYLKSRGIKRVYTYIDEENSGGIKFYQALGFEKEGLLKARVTLKGFPRNEYLMATIFY